jgi:histidine triad (HIT) family protein
VPSHEPEGYACPFCEVVAGRETEHTLRSDVVYGDGRATAFVSPRWWPANPGNVLVVPDEHHENVYAIPDELLAHVYVVTKRIAVAVRETYGCDGTSTRQHNEPGAGQDVWHFHVHVFPRHRGDDLYRRNAEARWATAEERAPYAAKLRASLS